MRKTFTPYTLSWIIIMFITVSISAQDDAEKASVKAVFDKYVSSVKTADINSMSETIASAPDLVFLTASGHIIEGTAAYRKFHDEWFTEKGWSIEFTEPKIYLRKDTAYTISKFIYREKNADGRIETLESWFTLIYGKENGLWKVITDICTPISRKINEPDSSLSYDKEQDFFFNVLKNRRTVRKFKSDPVPQAHIMKILEAARLAPTSGNQQPWKFLVITDRKKLNALSDKAADWIKKLLKEKYKKIVAENLSAPVLIVILVDSKAAYPDYIHTDGDLATENLILAARALGYGTGYYTSFYPEEVIKPFFNIPDNYRLICVTPIGIPESWPTAPPKKELKDIVIYESF
jgi:nitroreductase/ketosteroid isomerase-like protein